MADQWTVVSQTPSRPSGPVAVPLVAPDPTRVRKGQLEATRAAQEVAAGAYDVPAKQAEIASKQATTQKTLQDIKLAAQKAAKYTPNAADLALIKQLNLDAATAGTVALKANKFMEVQKSGKTPVNTGPWYGIHAMNVIGGLDPITAAGTWLDPRVGTLNGINAETWPLLRPAGSGRILGIEGGGFKTAFPNTAVPLATNEGLRQTALENAANANKIARYVSAYQGPAAEGLAQAYQQFLGIPLDAENAPAAVQSVQDIHKLAQVPLPTSVAAKISSPAAKPTKTLTYDASGALQQ